MASDVGIEMAFVKVLPQPELQTLFSSIEFQNLLRLFKVTQRDVVLAMFLLELVQYSTVDMTPSLVIIEGKDERYSECRLKAMEVAEMPPHTQRFSELGLERLWVKIKPAVLKYVELKSGNSFVVRDDEP